jgi:hypothetical protein
VHRFAAAEKKNDRIDAGKIADCLRCDFLLDWNMVWTEIVDGGPISVGRAPISKEWFFHACR